MKFYALKLKDHKDCLGRPMYHAGSCERLYKNKKIVITTRLDTIQAATLYDDKTLAETDLKTLNSIDPDYTYELVDISDYKPKTYIHIA